MYFQFHLDECLYRYVDQLNSANQERLQSKGKKRAKSKNRINLKDYLFDEENSQPKPSSFQDKMEPKEKQPSGQSARDGQDSAVTQPMIPRKKQKIKDGKIKIPDISNYLQIDEQLPPPTREKK